MEGESKIKKVIFSKTAWSILTIEIYFVVTNKSTYGKNPIFLIGVKECFTYLNIFWGYVLEMHLL